MHIVIKPWLTAFRRNRRQYPVLDLYHACFGRALDDPMHTNTRSLKKLAEVICEALHLRFVLDTMHLACWDRQVGPFLISVLCDPLTW